MSEFYQYFKENMDALGLAAPETLFANATTALATATALATQIDKFGSRVTLMEIVGAGTRLEKLAVVGACSAAFYAGAVVGSIAVATGRVLANGTSMSDVMLLLTRNHLDREWMRTCIQRHPGLYTSNHPGKMLYRHWQHTA
jgi:hypothetical protein